jgi:hypothetical protein
MPATYEPIATTTLGTTAASITFSSISSSYTDLRVVLSNVTVSSASGNLITQFNSTTTGYSQTFLLGSGSIAESVRYTNFDGIYGSYNQLPSTTVPTFFTLDIFSYAGSTFKTCLGTSSLDYNGSGEVARIVGLWRNTAAITSVKLDFSSNFKAGTTATIYGIKAA